MKPTVETLAATLISKFEGFQPVAKWDVNAWRLGFGSDTEGPDQVKVHRGMTTTKDRAIANLAHRIPEFEREAIRQIGGHWAEVPDAIKVPLLSVIYNYGHLPRDLPTLIIAHHWAGVAQEVEALGSDNGGINRHRREQESKLIWQGIPKPSL